MSIKGQIVEIPATSPIYKEQKVLFLTKKDELQSQSQLRNYSLFDGFLVGDHNGVHLFSIGQRKGINVGGKKAPLYVIGIDPNDNRLFVGESDQHPGLFTKVLQIKLNNIEFTEAFKLNDYDFLNGVAVKIKYQDDSEFIDAKLYILDASCFIEFDRSVSLLTQNNDFLIYHNNQIIATKK